MNVTPKQLELLQAVHAHREATGINASCAALGKILGDVCRVTIWARVQALTVLGLLTKGSDGTRKWHSIRLTPEGQAIVAAHRARPMAWKIAGTLSAKGVTWNHGKATPIQETA